MITLIENNTALGNIPDGIREANILLSGNELYNEIASRIEPFDYSDPADLLPKVIAEQLKQLTRSFKIVPTKLGKKTTGAYTCSATERETLYISNRRYHVNNSVAYIVGTLIHECVHALDCFSDEFEIGHGDNNGMGKENSAPYWIGNVAANIVNGTKDVVFDLVVEVM